MLRHYLVMTTAFIKPDYYLHLMIMEIETQYLNILQAHLKNPEQSNELSVLIKAMDQTIPPKSKQGGCLLGN